MLGIVCGLEAEAAIARGIRGALVACSAARPDVAREKAQELLRKGAKRLLSFGIAGGLRPGLDAGRLVIGRSIRSSKRRWPCDLEWLDILFKVFPEAEIGSVFGTDSIIASAAEKRSLYQRYGSLVADMESHAVAEAASDKGIPMAVVRVVVDTADMAVPKAALVSLNKDGKPDGLAVARNIMMNPFQIPALVHVGVKAAKAMTILQNVAVRFP